MNALGSGRVDFHNRHIPSRSLGLGRILLAGCEGSSPRKSSQGQGCR